jgi:peptidoglycan/xylan/chitin deacetylase (PgdA/CDA1 family)
MSRKNGLMQALLMIELSVVIAGCASRPEMIVKPLNPQYYPTSTGTSTTTSTPFQAMTDTPSFIPPSNTPTATDTPLPTTTPTPTDTPLPTDTPEMVWNPGGQITAPILLYHHVSDDGSGNRYYVTVDKFRAQMEALRDWGYTSITVTELAKVLVNGGDLPSRPVVITFDDGNLDIYQNAFPIMHEMGFVGITYIVGNRLQSKYFVNVEQIREMASAGWEIGSHSMTHTDLTTDYSIAHFEMRQSMLTLEDATGEPVSSFAYPYGKTDDFVSTKASEYGYSSGMGLGAGYQQYIGTLFYLSRMEIQGNYDMSKFASMLPWSGN